MKETSFNDTILEAKNMKLVLGNWKLCEATQLK